MKIYLENTVHFNITCESHFFLDIFLLTVSKEFN